MGGAGCLNSRIYCSRRAIEASICFYVLQEIAIGWSCASTYVIFLGGKALHSIGSTISFSCPKTCEVQVFKWWQRGRNPEKNFAVVFLGY